MALSINWLTKTIFVPKAYLTLVSGVLYELDANTFRLDLKAIEGSEDGMAHARTHEHNTEVTLSGVTYARMLLITNGYLVEFEDGQYSVRVAGANHNIGDVKVANQVSLIIGNSAGLITVTNGGVTAPSAAENANAVWAKTLEDGLAAEQFMRLFAAFLANNATGLGSALETFKSADGSKTRATSTVDEGGARIVTRGDLT